MKTSKLLLVSSLVVLLVCGVIIVNGSGGEHWSTFKGNRGRTSTIITGENAKPLMMSDWKFPLGSSIRTYPVADGNKVFVGSGKYFYALDKSTGSIIWRYKGDYDMAHTPSIIGGEIYIVYCNDDEYSIIALDHDTGELVNKMNMPAKPTFSLVESNSIFYTVSSRDKTEYICSRRENGDRVWSFQFPYRNTYDCMDDDILFIRNASQENGAKFPSGNIYALDSKTGAELWNQEPSQWDCSFDASIIANGGVLYIGTEREEGAYVLALSGQTGETIWEYETEAGSITCKALSGNRLLVADSLRGLFCLNAQTGKMMWSSSLSEMSDCMVACTQDIAYVCYPDSQVEKTSNSEKKSMIKSIDIATGDTLDFEKHEHTPYSICADGDRVYFTTEEGFLYSYKTDIGLVGIIVLPAEKMLIPGETMQFSFTNYDMRKRELEDLDVRWFVSPPSLGTITKDGLFTAGDGSETKSGLVLAKHGEISGHSMVTICDAPELDTEVACFGLMGQDESKSIIITTNMNRYCRCDLETLEYPDWIKVDGLALNPMTEIVELSLSAITDGLPPGEYVDIVSFKWLRGEIILDVSVHVIASEQMIFDANPSSVSFGTLKAWDMGKHDEPLTLTNLAGDPIGCNMITDVNWLDVNPRATTVYLEKNNDFVVTCLANKIKPGQSLTTAIQIKPQFGETQELSVSVNKLLNTTLKLRIDVEKAQLDGDSIGLDVPPQIVSGRTMVPIRVISEAFGAEVNWDSNERRIDVILNNLDGTQRVVKMWVGKDTAEVDESLVKLDSPPTVISGRTLVPVRFISEAFGASVSWNQADREVVIVYTP